LNEVSFNKHVLCLRIHSLPESVHTYRKWGGIVQCKYAVGYNNVKIIHACRDLIQVMITSQMSRLLWTPV